MTKLPKPKKPITQRPEPCRTEGCGERAYAHYNYLCQVCWNHQRETGELAR